MLRWLLCSVFIQTQQESIVKVLKNNCSTFSQVTGFGSNMLLIAVCQVLCVVKVTYIHWYTHGQRHQFLDTQHNGLPQGSVLALVLFNLYSNDLTSYTCTKIHLHWRHMSRHSRPVLQQTRWLWCGCHTSVDSGNLSQVPQKQLAVCSTCIIPAPPANCQFI